MLLSLININKYDCCHYNQSCSEFYTPSNPTFVLYVYCVAIVLLYIIVIHTISGSLTTDRFLLYFGCTFFVVNNVGYIEILHYVILSITVWISYNTWAILRVLDEITINKINDDVRDEIYSSYSDAGKNNTSGSLQFEGYIPWYEVVFANIILLIIFVVNGYNAYKFQRQIRYEYLQSLLLTGKLIRPSPGFLSTNSKFVTKSLTSKRNKVSRNEDETDTAGIEMQMESIHIPDNEETEDEEFEDEEVEDDESTLSSTTNVSPPLDVATPANIKPVVAVRSRNTDGNASSSLVWTESMFEAPTPLPDLVLNSPKFSYLSSAAQKKQKMSRIPDLAVIDYDDQQQIEDVVQEMEKDRKKQKKRIRNLSQEIDGDEDETGDGDQRESIPLSSNEPMVETAEEESISNLEEIEDNGIAENSDRSSRVNVSGNGVSVELDEEFEESKEEKFEIVSFLATLKEVVECAGDNMCELYSYAMDGHSSDFNIFENEERTYDEIIEDMKTNFEEKEKKWTLKQKKLKKKATKKRKKKKKKKKSKFDWAAKFGTVEEKEGLAIDDDGNDEEYDADAVFEEELMDVPYILKDDSKFLDLSPYKAILLAGQETIVAYIEDHYPQIRTMFHEIELQSETDFELDEIEINKLHENIKVRRNITEDDSSIIQLDNEFVQYLASIDVENIVVWVDVMDGCFGVSTDEQSLCIMLGICNQETKRPIAGIIHRPLTKQTVFAIVNGGKPIGYNYDLHAFDTYLDNLDEYHHQSRLNQNPLRRYIAYQPLENAGTDTKFETYLRTCIYGEDDNHNSRRKEKSAMEFFGVGHKVLSLIEGIVDCYIHPMPGLSKYTTCAADAIITCLNGAFTSPEWTLDEQSTIFYDFEADENEQMLDKGCIATLFGERFHSSFCFPELMEEQPTEYATESEDIEVQTEVEYGTDGEIRTPYIQSKIIPRFGEGDDSKSEEDSSLINESLNSR